MSEKAYQASSASEISAALAGLGGALAREVPRLETGLDVAFAQLRVARMAISSPWTAPETDTPVDVGALSDRLEASVGSENAAQFSAAMAASKTPDRSDAPKPQIALAQLQKRTAAAMSSMLSALQIRDGMGQRVNHLDALLEYPDKQPPEQAALMSTLISAQTEALFDDTDSSLENVAVASSAVVATIGEVAGADNSARTAVFASIRGAVISQFAGALWSADEDVADDLRGICAELYQVEFTEWCTSTLAKRFGDAAAAMDFAGATADQTRRVVFGLRSELAGVYADIASVDPVDPIFEEVWKIYTVDAEREAHNRLIQRRQAA
ncbi:MAG: hypothetical protein AAGK00_12315 [Pseudomonadota bacterium]